MKSKTLSPLSLSVFILTLFALWVVRVTSSGSPTPTHRTVTATASITNVARITRRWGENSTAQYASS